MLPAERRAKIVELINEKGSVSIESLARSFAVSEMTIRRDLEQCSRSGTIQRCYGGAVLKNEIVGETDYDDKLTVNLDIKKRLAQYCAQLVLPGMRLYLDAGTTVMCIAERIRNIPDLTVITNDLKTALFTAQNGINTLIVGGSVQGETGSVLGAMALKFVEDMRVDISFMGATSISNSFDVLTPTVEKAFMKRTVLANSNECYLVTDSSKFHRQALIKINHLSDYTAVVTDTVFTPEEKKAIKENRIVIINPLDERGD